MVDLRKELRLCLLLGALAMPKVLGEERTINLFYDRADLNHDGITVIEETAYFSKVYFDGLQPTLSEMTYMNELSM